VRNRASEVFAPQASDEQLVQGTIVEIKSEPDGVTVRSLDERNVPVELSTATTVRFSDGAGSLRDIHVGDRASIRYWPEYGRNRPSRRRRSQPVIGRGSAINA